MMTLGNMRENGVRTLSVRCLRCHHDVGFDVDSYRDDVTVPSFGPPARSMPMPDLTGTSGRRLIYLVGGPDDAF